MERKTISHGLKPWDFFTLKIVSTLSTNFNSIGTIGISMCKVDNINDTLRKPQGIIYSDISYLAFLVDMFYNTFKLLSNIINLKYL